MSNVANDKATRVTKARRRFEKLGYTEGEEMTLEVFDNIWTSYNGNKLSLKTSEAKKFLKDFWTARNLPYDATEADDLMEMLDPLSTGSLSYDRFRGLFLQVALKSNVDLSRALKQLLHKRCLGPSVEVFLNVYDLFDLGKLNDRTLHLGFGAFHSAVEVFGIELAFGYPAGIYTLTPRMSGIGRFREAISMGEAVVSIDELKEAISELQKEFAAEKYNIATFNCHTFSDALCMRLVHHHIPAFINNLPNFIKFFKPFIPEDLLTFKDRGEEVDVDIEKEATPPSAKSSKSRMKSSKKGFSARAEDESDDDVEYSKIPDDMKEELANAFAEPKTSDVVKKLVQKDHEDNEAKEQFVQAITEPNTNEVMRKLAKKNREKRERTNLDLSDSQDPYEATKEQLAESLSEPNTSDVMKKLAQKNKERLERQERERQERPASLIATDPTPPEHRRVRDRSRSRSRERPQTSESSSSQTVRRRQGRSKSRDRNQTSASGVDNDPNAAAKQQFAEALSDPDTSDVMKKLSQKNKEKRKGRSRSKSRDRGQATVVNPEHTEAQNESDLDAAKQLFGEALSDPDTSDVMKKLAQKNKDKMNRRSRSKSRDRGQASSVSPDPTPSVVIGTSQPEPILDPDMDAKRQFAETLSEPDSSDILKKLAQKRRERESVKPQEKVSNTGNNDEQKLNTGPSRTAPRRPDPSPLLGLEDFALSLALPESTDVVVRMTDRKDLREKGPPVREQSEPVLPSRMQSVVPATLSRGATSMSLQAAVPTISTPPISPTTPPLSSPARRQTLEDLSNSLIQPNTQDIMKKLAARNKTQAVATSQLLDQVIENVEEQIGSLQKLLEQLKDVKERGERSAHHIQDKEKPSDDSSGVLELASSSSVLVNPCMTTTPRTQATTEASTSTTSTTCTTNTPLVPKPVTVSSDLSAPRGSNIYQSADEYQSSLLFFQAQQQASQITSVILQAELESLKNRLGKEGAKTKAKSAYDSTLLLEDLLKQAAGIPKRPSPLAVSQVSTTPPQEIGSGRRSINYKTRPTSSRKKPVQPENEDGILDDILSKLSFRSRRSVIVKEREAKDLQPLERDALRLSIRLDGVDIDELMKTLHPELLK